MGDGMSEYSNKHCVILADFATYYPNHWPVTDVADTLDEALSQGSFDRSPAIGR